MQVPPNQPIPYGLIERIVKLRVKQNLSKSHAADRVLYETLQETGSISLAATRFP